MRASRRVRRRWDSFPGFVYLLVGTSGVYVSLVSVGGLTVRLFELAALGWLLFALPQLVIPRDGVLAMLYGLMASVLLSVTVHGFETSGLLLALRIGVAFALTVTVYIGLSQVRGGVQKGVFAWAIGGGVVALVGVVAWLLATAGVVTLHPILFESMSGFRAVSTLPDPNRFASFSAVLASVSGLMVLLSKRRWVWLALFLVSVLGVLTSGSRGGLLAGVVGVTLATGITFALGPPGVGSRLMRRVLPFAAVLGVGVVLLYAYAPQKNVFGRLTGEGVTMRESDQVATNIRLIYADYIWRKVSESPATLLFGSADYGRIEVDDNSNDTFSPHNLYLTVLAAQGLVGLTLFSVLLLWLIRRGVASLSAGARMSQEDTSVRAAMLAGLLTFVFHGATIALYTTGFFWIYVGLYLAVVSAPVSALAHAPARSRPRTHQLSLQA